MRRTASAMRSDGSSGMAPTGLIRVNSFGRVGRIPIEYSSISNSQRASSFAERKYFGAVIPPNSLARPIKESLTFRTRSSSSTASAAVRASRSLVSSHREHLKFVSSQPCVVCGRTPSDAHHIKFAEQRAMGRKVSDRFTIPICRLHHRELHRRGNERAWWESQGIEPLSIAATLWDKTHVVVPGAANIAGDGPTTMNGKLNGRHLGNGVGVAGRCRKDETKPILRREAE